MTTNRQRPGMTMAAGRIYRDSAPGRSGVVGVVGVVDPETLERNPITITTAREIESYFGRTTELLLPELGQLFLNGAQTVIVAGVDGGTRAAFHSSLIDIEAKVPGAWGNAVAFRLEPWIERAPDKIERIIGDLEVVLGDGRTTETYSEVRLAIDADEEDAERSSSAAVDDTDIVSAVAQRSSMIEVVGIGRPDQFRRAIGSGNGEATVQGILSGGSWPSIDEYNRTLELLEAHDDIELVTISISPPLYGQPGQDTASELQDRLLAHAERWFSRGLPRLALGTINPGASDPVADAVARAQRLASDRFVLVAPYGVQGAVAGAIVSTATGHSPALTNLRGIDHVSAVFSKHDLERLVRSGVLAIAVETPLNG